MSEAHEIELRAKDAHCTTHFFHNNYWGDANIFGSVVSIVGYPPCPVCFHEYLSLREFQEGECYWYCTDCGTEWEVEDLIEAMNTGEEE